MKNKLLTEQQAWTKIGRAWASENLILDKNGEVYIGEPDCGRYYGICCRIMALGDDCNIDYDVETAMFGKVNDFAPPPIDDIGFRWPLTSAGAKQRAAFCFRMARLCAKENKARKGKRK